MSHHQNAIPAAHERDEPLLDTFLREAVPEIKLSLGDLIDRDNVRAIPDRYAKLLPESVLVVTLRPDAAEAVRPIAAELEGELTDSCMRHGSLYDREYRVKLRVANAPGAPLFRVAVRKANEPEPEPFPPPPPPEPVRPPEPARNETPSPAAAATEVIRPGALGGETVVAPRPTPISETAPPRPVPPPEPAVDPDATRLEGPPPPPVPAAEAGAPGLPRFDAGRWTLVVEDAEGNEKERFPLPAPMSTVGRQTDNPELKSDVQVADVPHVSRRQLALVWAPRGDSPGFTVYNVGLNALHVGGREVPGANRGRGDLRLDELIADNSEWVGPGVPMRVGEHGPVIRLEDARAGSEDGEPGPNEEPAADDGVEVDPDATRLG